MTGIDRAGPNDLTNLAVDRGPAPMNIGAVLLLDGARGQVSVEVEVHVVHPDGPAAREWRPDQPLSHPPHAGEARADERPHGREAEIGGAVEEEDGACLLYTSDAADE